MSSTSGSAAPVRDFISPPAYKAFIWTSISLMSIAFTARAYIRVACFRRLLVEDWLMLISLSCSIVTTVLATIYIDHIYNLNHLVDGTFIPGPSFETDTRQSLRASAVTSIMTYIGLWIIKINFLLFFHRLGNQLPKFRAIWWFIFTFVIASGAAQIGIIKFDCMLGDLNTMLGACSTIDNLYDTRYRFIVSVTLDVLTDLFVLCFPISIVWSSRMTLRQKLILSGFFSLILFVIAITIIRGGFSTNIHDPAAATQLNTSANFWITLEYLVSFLVACGVSFRSLFIHRRKRDTDDADRHAQRHRPPTDNPGYDRRRLAVKMRQLHDSILDTCRELEGSKLDCEAYALPEPTSGLLTIDFSEGGAPSDWTATANTAHGSTRIATRSSRDDSVISLKHKQDPHSHV